MGRGPERGDADEIEASLMGESLDLLGELPALGEHCAWCHGSLQSLVCFRHVVSLYALREALYDVRHRLPILRRSPEARESERTADGREYGEFDPYPPARSAPSAV